MSRRLLYTDYRWFALVIVPGPSWYDASPRGELGDDIGAGFAARIELRNASAITDANPAYVSGGLQVKKLLLFLTCAACLSAQELDPAKLLKPATDTWPMYNGDYSGRRFSTLAKVNASNIDSLSLAWVFRIGAGESGFSGAIKATPVLLDGILYFTIPDHVWAIDARDGREVWNYTWQSRGGIHIGNRGVAVSGNWLYFETPDCNLVSLNLKDQTS